MGKHTVVAQLRNLFNISKFLLFYTFMHAKYMEIMQEFEEATKYFQGLVSSWTNFSGSCDTWELTDRGLL